jgi:hypothetical protein
LRDMNYEFLGYMYSSINRHLRDMTCQSLGYMYNSLDRYLRDMNYEFLGYTCLSIICQGCCTCHPQIGHFMSLNCLSRLLYM